MSARLIPYAVGLFMLVPLALWLVLWAVVFPGPKYGLDSPLTLAMGVVSLPLVAWFYLSTLGMLSNSLEGRSEFGRPSHYGIGWLMPRLPTLTLVLGMGAVSYLALAGEPMIVFPVPLVTAVVIAAAIHLGESARKRDRVPAPIDPEAPQRDAIGSRLGRGLLTALSAIPVFGWLLRDAIRGTDTDRIFFAVNLIMLAVLAVVFFGYPALIVLALSGVALAFAALFVVTSGA